MNDLKNLIYPVCDAAIKAGIVICQNHISNKRITYKEDQSPLTIADLESNKVIINKLTKINKDIPILTEESFVEWSIRKNWKTYWLVDPLDGTKDFVNDNDEFTVNIALIKNHHPIIGVIYAPALKLLYFSYKNGGSYKLKIDEENKIKDYFIKASRITTSTKSYNNLLTVLGSKSFSNYEFENWLNQNLNKFEVFKKGSSLKFCEIAEGTADIYPRFGPSCEWDIAAGHIILIEAGGKLESINRKEILYNFKKSVINPHFIASCKLEL